MKRHLKLLTATAVFSTLASSAMADWIFRPSTYSHDPATCRRVEQYAAKKVPYARNDPTYMESGYVHKRSTLRGADGSIDRRHVVQTWGAGENIRPYGEWEFPYRAGATPYGPWGNPQGPWTTPFDSWVNPYGQWNRYYPYPPFGYGGGYGGYGGGYGGRPGYGPPIATPYRGNTPHGHGHGSAHGGGTGPSHGGGYPTPPGPAHGGSSPHGTTPHGSGGHGGGHP